MYISTQEELKTLVQKIRGTPLLAIDTEFIREHHYYPQLEIIQIATNEIEAIIDFRALKSMTLFHEILNDPATIKVFHAATQDFEIFVNLTEAVPTPLFDTQVAAAMLGLGAQVGYARLVENLLQVSLAKSETMTDWSRRPLSASQLKYALEDVRYLLPVYKILQHRLTKMGRHQWLEEEWQGMADANLYEGTRPRKAYRRIKGINRLPSYQLTILRELAAWREEEAVNRNWAVKMIARDPVLLELARRQPSDMNQLYQVRGLHQREIKRSGQLILKAIKRAKALPRNKWPILPQRRTPITSEEESLVSLMQSWLRARAAEIKIAPNYLSTTAQLKMLVTASQAERAKLPVLRGWRRKLVGEDLLAIIEGRAGLNWDPRRGSLQLTFDED